MKTRRRFWCVAILFSSILLLPLIGDAQIQDLREYKDYTVQKGDTLWDITERELRDPFLWPKVWNANPQIANPDRIYPKQTIRIPFSLMPEEVALPEGKPTEKIEKEVERETKKPAPEKPRKRDFLIDSNLLLSSGFIADSVHSVGMIYDRPGEPSNLTRGDHAYIKTTTAAKKGDKFYIIQPVEKVLHPITGSYVGTRIAILGTAEVVEESDPKILITRSFVEIPIGSLLDTYYEIEPPLAPDSPRKPDIDGYIVTTLRQTYAHGKFDIVFIDKGAIDGLQIGDLLATREPSEHIIMNGTIQIVSVQPKTASAVIKKSVKEIRRGDPVCAVRQE